jgi:hypothetical protein
MKLVKILAAALGFCLVGALAGSFMPPAASASGGAPVTVLNTPLPVQGSVSVNNFPARQSVSGTVNVGNLPAVQSVSFSNTNLNPLFVQNVENPARTGFQVSARCTFDQFARCLISPIYTVSGGQIAVIEYASGVCAVDPGTTVSEVLVLFTQGSSSNMTDFHLVPGQAISFAGESVASFGQEVRAYVTGGPSGNPLVFEVFSSGPESGQADGCSFSLAGYTVNQ